MQKIESLEKEKKKFSVAFTLTTTVMLTAGVIITFYNVAMIKTEVHINGCGIEDISGGSPSSPLKRVGNYFWLKDRFCFRVVLLL